MDLENAAKKYRSGESIKLLQSLDLGDRVSSAVYLHVLDVIGAISCLSNKSKSKRSKLEAAEQKLFWKTLGEISLLHGDEEDTSEEINPALSTVLLSFPKEKSTGDDWLPLHFSLSLKTIDLEITQALLTAQPQRTHMAILATNLWWWLDYHDDDDDDNDNDKHFAIPALKPYHLAFMRKEPCPGLIDQLCAFDANFASTEASDGSLPLHVAARYSNSVDLIRELVNLYPDALKLKNKSLEIPLHVLGSNGNPAVPEIVNVFVQAAPETVKEENNEGSFPLHVFASSRNIFDSSSIATLIDAYPEALRFSNSDGRPIDIAANEACTEVLQSIVERTDLDNLDASVCHSAVSYCKLEKIHYLYSIKPELLLEKFEGKTSLHVAIGNHGRRCYDRAFIRAVASLAPQALTMTDDDGNNLLHTLVSRWCISKDDGAIEETMRFLLRSIPGGAIATNNAGQTPFDVLNSNNTATDWSIAKKMKALFSSLRGAAMSGGDVSSSGGSSRGGGDEEEKILDSILFVLRRLLLIAGAPSLHPALRKEMNYTARKDALFAFLADRKADGNQNSSSSSSGEPDILFRIRNGPGSLELMKQIVSFL